jgi:hypothetical protein
MKQMGPRMVAVMLNPEFHGDPEPIDLFMVPAGWWSDGTADLVKPD